MLVYDATRLTVLGADLKRLHDAGASASEIKREVRTYQESPIHVKTLNRLPVEVKKALHWIAEHSSSSVKDLNLNAAVKALYGQSARELVTTNAFKTTLERLSHAIVAEAFAQSCDHTTDGLVLARKWLAPVNIAPGNRRRNATQARAPGQFAAQARRDRAPTVDGRGAVRHYSGCWRK